MGVEVLMWRPRAADIRNYNEFCNERSPFRTSVMHKDVRMPRKAMDGRSGRSHGITLPSLG